MTKCIIANCTYPQAPALKRGLCMRCYSSAKVTVEAGGVTWDELVGLGLALSTTEAGGDPFTVALNKKMEGS
jgi:hypothetical protein